MLRPLNDHVFIERAESERAFGLIELTEGAQIRELKGTVIYCGPGKPLRNGERAPMLVSPGDKVIFSRHAGGEVKYLDETFLVVKEEEIIAVLES